MTEKTAFHTALAKAMALCSRMEYCSGDMHKKLQSWGISSGDEHRIIKELTDQKFINDERYAKAFVRDKFRYNKWGKLKIAAHLRAKNINSEAIESALGEIDCTEYINLLKNLINSHKKTIKAKNQYDLKGKLLRFGSSKGFESSILYDILNEME